MTSVKIFSTVAAILLRVTEVTPLFCLMKRNLCNERLAWCQFAFLECRQLGHFGVVQRLTSRVLEYVAAAGCERRIYNSLGAKFASLQSRPGFRMGRIAKSELHQHVAK